MPSCSPFRSLLKAGRSLGKVTVRRSSFIDKIPPEVRAALIEILRKGKDKAAIKEFRKSLYNLAYSEFVLREYVLPRTRKKGGAPRQDELAEKAWRMHESGLTYGEIKIRLREKRTADAIGKLARRWADRQGHLKKTTDKTP
jgi:hypothetical protein